ncbi:hypothetical protein CRE_22991 [Caenorhabditis remanei]|uniref:Uncharacterized protein n=1 Tax=Caenorhabditis remanei TaxID=31234 RepID=E3N4C9_CAERE|nr:hypothetical protein CRE_22991 [Caenorhabditis remanei]
MLVRGRPRRQRMAQALAPAAPALSSSEPVSRTTTECWLPRGPPIKVVVNHLGLQNQTLRVLLDLSYVWFQTLNLYNALVFPVYCKLSFFVVYLTNFKRF